MSLGNARHAPQRHTPLSLVGGARLIDATPTSPGDIAAETTTRRGAGGSPRSLVSGVPASMSKRSSRAFVSQADMVGCLEVLGFDGLARLEPFAAPDDDAVAG